MENKNYSLKIEDTQTGSVLSFNSLGSAAKHFKCSNELIKELIKTEYMVSYKYKFKILSVSDDSNYANKNSQALF